MKNAITILELLIELSKCVVIDKAYYKRAKVSKITTENCAEFKDYYECWCSGIYDANPEWLYQNLKSIL